MKTTVNAGFNAQKKSTKAVAPMKIAHAEKPAADEAQETSNVAQAAEKVEEPAKEEARALIQGFAITAEERIKKARNFQVLSQRFEFLKEKADELERFQMENTGTNTHLTLRNQTGFEFKVSSSTVIEKALTVITQELKALLSKTETEIVDYEM